MGTRRAARGSATHRGGVVKTGSRTFKERPIRHATVNGTSKPSIGDRFLALTHSATQVSLGHASRITRIVEDDSTTRYELADRTIITAPAGARITWEEQ